MKSRRQPVPKSLGSGVVALLRAKDPAGFVELMAKYGRLFRWYFLSHGMQQGEAEERALWLIEDVAMFKIDQYEGDDSCFGAWISTLMRNEAVNWWRERHGTTAGPLPDQLAAPEEFPDETELDETMKGVVGIVLDKLRPEDRRIFEAHVLYGMTFGEVGKELAITAGNAKVRYFRIKERLKRILIEQGPNLPRTRLAIQKRRIV